MESTYIRFWFEFNIENRASQPAGIGWGVGVTAIDQDDAIKIINQKIFKGATMPGIKRMVENIDIRDLDQGHVLPNINPPNWRGVWFPKGYDF